MTVAALRPAPRAPRVYLAGKIAKNLPWRTAALGSLTFLDPNRGLGRLRPRGVLRN